MKNTHGFTLIELMVTLAIAAILLAVASPSFSTFITNQKLKSGTQLLNSSLRLARTEAVKRRAPIYLTANTNWKDGWIITTSASRTYTECVNSPTADCIRVFSAQDDLSLAPSSSSVTQISYNRSGRLTSSNFSFTVCDSDLSSGFTKRLVEIGANGMSSTSYGNQCS